MNVLVITGCCLTENSSASLCHCAYIQGLLDCGYNVDLISTSEKYHHIDENIILPKVNNHYKYDCSLYERISYKKKNTNNAKKINISNPTNVKNNRKSIFYSILDYLKIFIRKSYGIHSFYFSWYKRAKKFKNNTYYDHVISLSTPVVSHLLVHDLIKNNRIKCKHWIQIWEDPWSQDLYLEEKDREKYYKEEKRILSFAEKVLYVSPITLDYQKKAFKEYSSKMYWAPLPSYYSTDNAINNDDDKVYGYFGNYVSKVRNLNNFYEASKLKGIVVNICGYTDQPLNSVDNINVYPRLDLKDLSVLEMKTNVLVFLSNLNGGQIPGKIYQYSASDKIILFILDGTDEEKEIMFNYFSKFNRYIFCENDVQSICEAIDKITNNQFDDILCSPVNEFIPSNIIKQILKVCGE